MLPTQDFLVEVIAQEGNVFLARKAFGKVDLQARFCDPSFVSKPADVTKKALLLWPNRTGETMLQAQSDGIAPTVVQPKVGLPWVLDKLLLGTRTTSCTNKFENEKITFKKLIEIIGKKEWEKLKIRKKEDEEKFLGVYEDLLQTQPPKDANVIAVLYDTEEEDVLVFEKKRKRPIASTSKEASSRPALFLSPVHEQRRAKVQQPFT